MEMHLTVKCATHRLTACCRKGFSRKKFLVTKFIPVFGAPATGGVLVLTATNLHALAGNAMTGIRDSGPGAYFTLMALLPAPGLPILTFTLPAGADFR
jgi:hypothetical protein